MELEYKDKFKSGTMAFKEGNYQLAFGYYREVLKYIDNNDINNNEYTKSCILYNLGVCLLKLEEEWNKETKGNKDFSYQSYEYLSGAITYLKDALLITNNLLNNDNDLTVKDKERLINRKYKILFNLALSYARTGDMINSLAYATIANKYNVNNDEECLMLIEKSKEHLESYINDNEL